MNNTALVSEINEFYHKSFENYTGPADKFSRSNIFYAPNGNGKTSLSKGIIDEYNDK